mmetsp:Transcript_26660/g.67808  ORF Transcript_26660/g.67808 Transcript_26660/m.67808 type:complete len:87 (-) Transcript_26660:60-320(-)
MEGARLVEAATAEDAQVAAGQEVEAEAVAALAAEALEALEAERAAEAGVGGPSVAAEAALVEAKAEWAAAETALAATDARWVAWVD